MVFQGHLIRFYSVFNLVLAWGGLFLFRGKALGRFPLFGRTGWTFEILSGRAYAGVLGTARWLEGLSTRRFWRLLLLLAGLSALLKALNALGHDGYFSGDDVEVLEMTLSRLLGWPWRAWDLRNAFFPFTFIFPAQYGVWLLGVRDPWLLDMTGRAVIILFSSVNILLLYRVTKIWSGRRTPALFAAALLAFSQLSISLSSTVLPRPVSTTFLLLATLLYLRAPARRRSLLGVGLCLGLATTIRFSEGIFLLPFLAHLAWRRRWRQAFLLGMATVLSALMLLGVSDTLYWGSPLHSLKHIVTYTLVQGQSSRGTQSLFFYLTHLKDWTNPVLPCFLPLAWRRRRAGLMGVLFLLPLLLLSLLPHKEARYLVPLLPFFCALVGVGVWRFLRGGIQNRAVPRDRRVSRAGLLVLALLLALLFEADGYHALRSESGVVLARTLTAMKPLQHVAVEQIWRAGSRVYLGAVPDLRDIDTDRSRDPGYLEAVLEDPVLEAVALKASTLARNGCEALLGANGFSEVSLRPCSRDPYRLFVRRRFREAGWGGPSPASGPAG